MQPTPEYTAAHEVGRSRLHQSFGAIHVVVENFSDAEHLAGRSSVYLSTDGGASFSLLPWQVSWLSVLKKLGREWPPHHIETVSISKTGLRLSYFEATYDGPVDYEATYRFSSKNWHLS